MPHNKLTKSQRELFCNLKAFLYTKAKNFTPIQDVKDMALILDTQDKILKCHNIEQLKQLCHILYNQGIKHTIMMQGLFLFFNYFKDNLKLRSFRMLSEEQVINFLFELAQNRKPSSMAKYVMYLRQFFDYLDRKRRYSFDFTLKNLAFAKTKESLPRHVKHPTAKAIGLPWLMLPIGEVWFSLCVPNHRDFTEFDLQRIPYRSHTSYLQRRNFAYFLR